MQKTISLDGDWNVVFDPEDRGRAKGWSKGLPRGVPVPVPGIWELAKPGYDGAGWYGRDFEIEPAWAGKILRLRFGAVNYACRVWVNGMDAGGHEGGYTPFVLDIGALVRPGANRLVVRVVDPPRDRAVDGFISSAPLRQTDIPVWKAGWYHNFGGIWQDVDLLVHESTFIDDLFVLASCLRRTVRVECTVVHHGPAQTVVLRAAARPHRGAGGALFAIERKAQLTPGVNTIRFERALTAFTPWDCENPFLYDLDVELVSDGRTLHRHRVRFGIRDFDAKDGRFLLNGRRIVLKGFVQQGVYPVTIAFPHDRAMARREMRLLKDHGFNFIRAHLKPSPPEILDLADEMGFVIHAEPPLGWILPTPAAAARAEREVRELVLRDRNRPSVAFWCLFNELTEQATIALRRDHLMRLARRLDPTRLVIGVAGCWDGNGFTPCLLPYSAKRESMVVEGAYYGATQQGLTRFREEDNEGKAGLISEFGAVETLMPYREVLANYTPAQRRKGLEDYAQYKSYYDSLRAIFREGGLGRIWKDPGALNDEVDRLREEEIRLEVSNIRVNPQWQGYAFCQLADASGEIFGATDLWRNPKRIFHGLAAAGRTPWITPFVDPRVVRPGERVQLQAWLIHEDRRGAPCDVSVTIETPAGRRVAGFDLRAKARGWSERVLAETVAAPKRPGTYVLRGVVRERGKTLADNTMTFTVLPAPERRADTIAFFDMARAGDAAFEARGYRVERAHNNYRRKDLVTAFAMNGASHPVLVEECLGAARRIVKAGGVLLLLDQDWPLFWWHLVKRPVRTQPMMRHVLYAHDHPVFEGLPGRGILGHAFDGIEPRRLTRARDVIANGARVVGGALNAHMWTQPDVYFWGSFLDVLPLGRGHVVTCALPLLSSKAPAAENLLANLVNYAQGLIRPGGEAGLLAARCIDGPV